LDCHCEEALSADDAISQKTGILVFVMLFILLTASPVQAQTNFSPVKRSIVQTHGARVSQKALVSLVRDFRKRLGSDAHLYYLVNPPGGATDEERKQVEGEIVHFLSRIHKDPTLDFPTKWLKELREFDLTAAEWSVIESYFQSALTASTLPTSIQFTLNSRFTRLRSEVLS
jgi:hypothetical protein